MNINPTSALTHCRARGSRLRRRLMASASVALCLGVLIAHDAAMAQATSGQAFQGTPTVSTGSATIVQTAPLDTITVLTPQAVIDWKPNDTNGTGTIDFLPVNASARFTGLQDFTVLNRIIPVDGNDIPIARMIALNGTITSDINGQAGGNVWFYSPGGILVSQGAFINVGSLVLSSRDIDTSGGLFGAGGTIRFRDPNLAGANGANITIESGASIIAGNATPSSAYIAVVAPRIVQSGFIYSDGSTALVAAEQADVRINNGLFDITVTVGTTDANGLVHTGTTGGPSSTSNSAYLVAVPKNQAMTMLLSGRAGYSDSYDGNIAFATGDGRIVISSGFNIAGGNVDQSAAGSSAASVAISDITFYNDVIGAATDSIVGRPTGHCFDSCNLNSLGQLYFGRHATLFARNRVDLSIGDDQRIYSGGDMQLLSARAGQGGIVRLAMDGADTTTGDSGGTITLIGSLLLDASAQGKPGVNDGAAIGGTATLDLIEGTLTTNGVSVRASALAALTGTGTGATGTGGTASVIIGQDATLTTTYTGTGTAFDVTANGTGGALGGSGAAGTARLDVTGNGVMTVTGGLFVTAEGYGTAGAASSGNGTGGTAKLNVDGPTARISAPNTNITAGGFGGGGPINSMSSTPMDTVTGGNGVGGSALLNVNAGTANLGVLRLNSTGSGGDPFLSADNAMARGGNATGGIVAVDVTGAGLLTATSAELSADGTAGSSGGASGMTGTSAAGNITVDLTTGTFRTTGDISFFANAFARGERGGIVNTLTGGNIALFAEQGGLLSVGGRLHASAVGRDSNGGPQTSPIAPVAASRDAQGGTISIESRSEAQINAGFAELFANAHSNNAIGVAGNATGGDINLIVRDNGNIRFAGSNRFVSLGSAGTGARGGTGTGGDITINVESGTMNLSPAGPLGPGGATSAISIGQSGQSNGDGGLAGFSQGGTVALTVGGTAPATLNFGALLLSSFGETNITTALGQPYSGAGSDAFGGLVVVDLLSTAQVTGTQLIARSFGTGRNGGDGTGGTVDFNQSGTSTIGLVFLQSRGFGFGANGLFATGDGFGGTVNAQFTGGTLTSQLINIDASGFGGDGYDFSAPLGAPHVGLTDQLNGGDAAGGTVNVTITGTANVIASQAFNASANARGGHGGDIALLSGSGGGGGIFVPGGNSAGGGQGSLNHSTSPLDLPTPGTGGSATAGTVNFNYVGGLLSNGSTAGDPAVGTLSATATGGDGGNLSISPTSGFTLPNATTRPDGGDATGGSVTLSLANSDGGIDADVDVRAYGGEGGMALAGGHGGDATGGTASFIIDNIDVGNVAPGIFADGAGGHGGHAINGSGGDGGDGKGGVVVVAVDGDSGYLGLEVDGGIRGTGGTGGNAAISPLSATIAMTGYSGGNGGDGTGGDANLVSSDGARIVIFGADGGPARLSLLGLGGAAGNGADNSAGPTNTARVGGNAGFGGGGFGGNAHLLARGGTIASDTSDATLEIDVGGVGGAGGSGGAGNVITLLDPQTGLPTGTAGGPGFSTGPGFSQGGSIRLEAMENAGLLGLITLGNVTLRANADSAGRINLIDDSRGPGLSLLALDAQATGSPVFGHQMMGDSGIFITSKAGAITISNSAALITGGTVQLVADGDGGLDVGAVLTTSSQDFLVRHTNRGANTSIDANLVDAFANGMIDFADGTLIQAASDILLNAGGNIHFGALQGQVIFALSGGGSVTGTLATTLVEGGDYIDLFGLNGVDVDTVRSMGTTRLTANSGAVLIDDLRSAGVITAAGRSVTITGSSGLTFAGLDATAGDARVTATSGALTVQNGTVSGKASLTTQDGPLVVQTLTGNRVALDSGSTIRITGTVTGTSMLTSSSGGATTIQGVATGGTVQIASADIAIGATGRVGTAGTTSLVELINNDDESRTFIGGTDQDSDYSLSATEMTRLFGRDITVRAPGTTGQGDLAIGSTSPPDVVIDDFTLNGAAGTTATAPGNLGSGGTLSIITDGSARVIGAAQLSNMASDNGFTISASESLEVILGEGSVRLTGGEANGLGGILTLNSHDIVVATFSAIGDIAEAADIDAIDSRLAMNDGITSEGGALVAGTINLDAINGVFIQNSGSSDELDDRRGFTTNALNITTEGDSTSIVINGRIADAMGSLMTGSDAIALATINGVQGAVTGFTSGSTINGCEIANPAGCNVSQNFDQRDVIRNILQEDRRRNIVRRALVQIVGNLGINLRDVDTLADQPLVDEPITGTGNDDLWTPTDTDGQE